MTLLDGTVIPVMSQKAAEARIIEEFNLWDYPTRFAHKTESGLCCLVARRRGGDYWIMSDSSFEGAWYRYDHAEAERLKEVERLKMAKREKICRCLLGLDPKPPLWERIKDWLWETP